MRTPKQFVRDELELERELSRIKQCACPRCRRTETLNRHDKRYGNDPEDPGKKTLRGQRVWCSTRRGKRRGCGHALCILLARVLPRHTFDATLLQKLLSRLLDGASIQAASQQIGIKLGLESVYHILQRFRHRAGAVRSVLLACCSAPPGGYRDPLLQTVEHLRSVFSGRNDFVEAFQVRFQSPIMG
jgi:hypothetical protein